MYIISFLWKNSNKFRASTDNYLNFILYEGYYKENPMLYVSTLYEEDNVIIQYIKNNFKSYLITSTSTDNMGQWNFMVNFAILLKQHCCSVTNDNRMCQNARANFYILTPKN